MSAQSKIKTTPNCAVFSRNFEEHLEGAIQSNPEEKIAFRSNKPWTSAKDAVNKHGYRKIYFAPIGDSKMVEYEAILEKVILNPKSSDPQIKNLLKNNLSSTDGEGLWEEDGKGGVKTIYVISHCHKLASPFPYTRLIKISDDLPINENFNYSYSMVYELS